ncbi:MAG: fluoride efflux transporter CrcB [Thermomicrobiales bacterium]|nr:fluoride efflux transporter CrcB [Thermomicrobiales bacterium]
MQPYLLVGLGGIAGANLRYLVSSAAASRWGTLFPYGTLVINLVGSFLLGVLLTAVTGPDGANARALLGTGFCGGFTTFSTFAFETIALAWAGDRRGAVVNALGTIGLGLAAAALGVLLGSAVAGW